LIRGHIPALFRGVCCRRASRLAAASPRFSAFPSARRAASGQAWANPPRVASTHRGSGQRGLRRTHNFSTGTFRWSLISTRILAREVRNLSVDFTAYSGFVPTPPIRSGVQGSAHRVALRRETAVAQPPGEGVQSALLPSPARTRPAARAALPSARPPASHAGEKRSAPVPESIGTTRRPPWDFARRRFSPKLCGWRPSFSSLRTTRFLPSTVRGPVDLRALARLAASNAGVRVGDLRKAMSCIVSIAK
jgi:hypothetical protein